MPDNNFEMTEKEARKIVKRGEIYHVLKRAENGGWNSYGRQIKTIGGVYSFIVQHRNAYSLEMESPITEELFKYKKDRFGNGKSDGLEKKTS